MSDPGPLPYPEIAGLIPHAEPMRLLSRVLVHDADSTVCLVEPAGHELFHDAEGRVPAWVGVEYMAQCIAAHAGLEIAETGKPPRVGYLLGSRSVRFHRARLPAQGRIEVSARHVRGRPGLGAMSFACEIVVQGSAGARELVAEGTLNVALAPPDARAESRAAP